MYCRNFIRIVKLEKKGLVFFVTAFSFVVSHAQNIIWEDKKLNTAANAIYMEPEEREMIYEINRLRSDPSRYAKSFIVEQLQIARNQLEKYGKGYKNYSLSTSYTDNVKTKTDTIWHFENEEMVNALQTLYDTLLRLKPLGILQPEKGIYKACQKHAADQAVNREVNHHGNDGSWPWDRIMKNSPQMKDGNENIAFNSSLAIPREIVLQLLIDAGISGYGHRYNMLNAQWTHVACYYTKKPGWSSKWWIQNFGRNK